MPVWAASSMFGLTVVMIYESLVHGTEFFAAFDEPIEVIDMTVN